MSKPAGMNSSRVQPEEYESLSVPVPKGPPAAGSLSGSRRGTRPVATKRIDYRDILVPQAQASSSTKPAPESLQERKSRGTTSRQPSRPASAGPSTKRPSRLVEASGRNSKTLLAIEATTDSAPSYSVQGASARQGHVAANRGSDAAAHTGLPNVTTGIPAPSVPRLLSVGNSNFLSKASSLEALKFKAGTSIKASLFANLGTQGQQVAGSRASDGTLLVGFRGEDGEGRSHDSAIALTEDSRAQSPCTSSDSDGGKNSATHPASEESRATGSAGDASTSEACLVVQEGKAAGNGLDADGSVPGARPSSARAWGWKATSAQSKDEAKPWVWKAATVYPSLRSSREGLAHLFQERSTASPSDAGTPGNPSHDRRPLQPEGASSTAGYVSLRDVRLESPPRSPPPTASRAPKAPSETVPASDQGLVPRWSESPQGLPEARSRGRPELVRFGMLDHLPQKEEVVASDRGTEGDGTSGLRQENDAAASEAEDTSQGETREVKEEAATTASFLQGRFGTQRRVASVRTRPHQRMAGSQEPGISEGGQREPLTGAFFGRPSTEAAQGAAKNALSRFSLLASASASAAAAAAAEAAEATSSAAGAAATIAASSVAGMVSAASNAVSGMRQSLESNADSSADVAKPLKEGEIVEEAAASASQEAQVEVCDQDDTEPQHTGSSVAGLVSAAAAVVADMRQSITFRNQDSNALVAEVGIQDEPQDVEGTLTPSRTSPKPVASKVAGIMSAASAVVADMKKSIERHGVDSEMPRSRSSYEEPVDETGRSWEGTEEGPSTPSLGTGVANLVSAAAAVVADMRRSMSRGSVADGALDPLDLAQGSLEGAEDKADRADPASKAPESFSTFSVPRMADVVSAASAVVAGVQRSMSMHSVDLSAPAEAGSDHTLVEDAAGLELDRGLPTSEDGQQEHQGIDKEAEEEGERDSWTGGSYLWGSSLSTRHRLLPQLSVPAWKVSLGAGQAAQGEGEGEGKRENLVTVGSVAEHSGHSSKPQDGPVSRADVPGVGPDTELRDALPSVSATLPAPAEQRLPRTLPAMGVGMSLAGWRLAPTKEAHVARDHTGAENENAKAASHRGSNSQPAATGPDEARQFPARERVATAQGLVWKGYAAWRQARSNGPSGSASVPPETPAPAAPAPAAPASDASAGIPATSATSATPATATAARASDEPQGPEGRQQADALGEQQQDTEQQIPPKQQRAPSEAHVQAPVLGWRGYLGNATRGHQPLAGAATGAGLVIGAVGNTGAGTGGRDRTEGQSGETLRSKRVADARMQEPPPKRLLPQLALPSWKGQWAYDGSGGRKDLQMLGFQREDGREGSASGSTEGEAQADAGSTADSSLCRAAHSRSSAVDTQTDGPSREAQQGGGGEAGGAAEQGTERQRPRQEREGGLVGDLAVSQATAELAETQATAELADPQATAQLEAIAQICTSTDPPTVVAAMKETSWPLKLVSAQGSLCCHLASSRLLHLH